MRHWKQSVGLLCLLVMAGVLLASGFVALDSYLDPFNDRPFSPARWATIDAQGRGPMARDALRHISVGTTKERVLDLLGEGMALSRDRLGPVDAYGVRLNHPATMVYWLGGWSGFGPYGFDDAFLYVHFGTDGRVAAAEINGG